MGTIGVIDYRPGHPLYEEYLAYMSTVAERQAAAAAAERERARTIREAYAYLTPREQAAFRSQMRMGGDSYTMERLLSLRPPIEIKSSFWEGVGLFTLSTAFGFGIGYGAIGVAGLVSEAVGGLTGTVLGVLASGGAAVAGYALGEYAAEASRNAGAVMAGFTIGNVLGSALNIYKEVEKFVDRLTLPYKNLGEAARRGGFISGTWGF